MQTDYSIESAAENIDNPQTKEYFREVLSSYHIENFRSAVVMIWSVVICDLVFKLQQLRDVDSDAIAKEILDDIEAKQKANPKSPEWENHLVKLIKDKTELIDAADYSNLSHIQEIRHLSAHPVLSNEALLFNPHKEQVRAFMRTALDAVLTKPPVFLNKIVDRFVSDIAAKRDLLIDDASLRRYLEARYFRRLRPASENQLFKALWKFVFRIENEDTNQNRNINYRCLMILFARRPAELKDLIRDNANYFSSFGGPSTVGFLMDFLAENPDVYRLLDGSAHVVIEQRATTNLEHFASAIYLSDSFDAHLSRIQEMIESQGTTFMPNGEYISADSWERLRSHVHDSAKANQLRQIAIDLYVKSSNFSTADYCFQNLIQPLMHDFSADDISELIRRANDNGQVTGRRRATADHTLFIEAVEAKLPIEFNESDYPYFFSFRKSVKNSG